MIRDVTGESDESLIQQVGERALAPPTVEWLPARGHRLQGRRLLRAPSRVTASRAWRASSSRSSPSSGDVYAQARHDAGDHRRRPQISGGARRFHAHERPPRRQHRRVLLRARELRQGKRRCDFASWFAIDRVPPARPRHPEDHRGPRGARLSRSRTAGSSSSSRPSPGGVARPARPRPRTVNVRAAISLVHGSRTAA